MAGKNWAVWGTIVGFGWCLGCGGGPAGHQSGGNDAGQPPPATAGAPGNGAGGGPASAGGAAGQTVTGAAGAAPAGNSPSSFVSPGTSFAPGSLCEVDGWCWYDPRPSGDWWRAVAGAGSAEVWIGGMTSNLLHLAPGGWSAVMSPLATTDAIWAAAADDVWFGGVSQAATAAIAHWDGHALTVTAELNNGQGGEVDDIWGSGPNDVYAIGLSALEHWDGTSWSAVPGVTMLAQKVSGSGPDDVWISASDGLLHFDGTSWSRIAQFEGQNVIAVASAAANDVWAAAASNGVEYVTHFDGSAWTTSLQLPSPVHPDVQDIVVGAGGAKDVWLAGTDFDGKSNRGYLAHFDGTTWTVAPTVPTPIYRVSGTRGFGDLAVGRGGGIFTLTSVPVVGFAAQEAGPAQTLTGVWGSSPSDMWAVGAAGTVLHFDGISVTSVPAVTSADLTDVWGTGPDDVWIVGRQGTAMHFDGHALSPVATGIAADLLAVFTAASGDVWIAGDGSTLAHFDGTTFQPVALTGLPTPFAVYDLHGLGAADVWLSGGSDESGLGSGPAGFVSHFDGTSWAPVEILTANDTGDPLRRIWALAPGDVWALTQPTFRDIVGFWHFDGTAWTDESMPSSPATFMFPDPQDALGSFVFGPHDRWMVGILGAWERNTQ